MAKPINRTDTWSTDQVFAPLPQTPTSTPTPVRQNGGQSGHFVTSEKWNVDRPDVMVVACSDGRLQFSIDHFLDRTMSVRHYDCMFMPGGSGALVAGGCEFLRAEHYRRDLYFLLFVFGLVVLFLLVLGAVVVGPVVA